MHFEANVTGSSIIDDLDAESASFDEITIELESIVWEIEAVERNRPSLNIADSARAAKFANSQLAVFGKIRFSPD